MVQMYFNLLNYIVFDLLHSNFKKKTVFRLICIQISKNNIKLYISNYNMINKLQQLEMKIEF